MGPLKGFKIVEIAGLGPSQFAGMLLADMGASVIRIGRPFDTDVGFAIDPRFDILNRSRSTIGVDLKIREGAELVLDLCEDADAIFEGFRPGAMERLGLGPGQCMQRNPKLVYGRMTGWGQDGPLARVDGVPSLMTMLHGYLAAGMWSEERDENIQDGAAPFFAKTYRTLDDEHMVIAPIEGRFFKILLDKLGLDDIDPAQQYRQSEWGELKRRFEGVFKTRTRDEWCEILEPTDACATPILSASEAMEHPHYKARGTFVTVDGIKQAAPAPRFSRTSSEISSAAGPIEADTRQALKQWGASGKVLGRF